MISILETKGERAYNITEFLADSIEDLAFIPKVHAGDIVYITDIKEWRILDSNKVWQPMKDQSFSESNIGG